MITLLKARKIVNQALLRAREINVSVSVAPVVEAGIVQGGCGVCGAPTAEEDEDCARAGIAALDSSATEPALPPYSDRSSSSLSMASSA